MQLSLTPSCGRVRSVVLFALTVFTLGAGCSLPSGYNPQGSSSSRLLNKAYFVVEAPPGASANISVNGEPRGSTPLHLRLDADESGRLLEDVELTAEWNDSRGDTRFSISAGSRPPAVVRLNPNGIIGF